MVRIRAGKKSDKKEFLKVQKEAFPDLNPKKQSKYYDEKIKKKEVFVAKFQRNYAGHLCFGKYRLEPPFIRGIFTEELAVKKQFRNNEIGTALIRYLKEYCKKNKFSVLYVGTGDYKGNKAIKYYKNLGFKKVGSLKDINPKSEYKHGQLFFALIVR